MHNKLLCIALVGIIATLAFGGVRCYQVEPCHNDNAWTSGQPNLNNVSQPFVLSSDSLDWAEVFRGHDT